MSPFQALKALGLIGAAAMVATAVPAAAATTDSGPPSYNCYPTVTGARTSSHSGKAVFTQNHCTYRVRVLIHCHYSFPSTDPGGLPATWDRNVAGNAFVGNGTSSVDCGGVPFSIGTDVVWQSNTGDGWLTQWEVA